MLAIQRMDHGIKMFSLLNQQKLDYCYFIVLHFGEKTEPEQITNMCLSLLFIYKHSENEKYNFT